MKLPKISLTILGRTIGNKKEIRSLNAKLESRINARMRDYGFMTEVVPVTEKELVRRIHSLIGSHKSKSIRSVNPSKTRSRSLRQ